MISTDDYELYRNTRGAFLPILQAHMTSFSMLFIGLSFTDPNVKHVLTLIREAFHSAPPEHFAIVRPPHRSEFPTDDAFNARLTQHKLWADDLLRYGLHVIEIDSYDEVPGLLGDVEQLVARNRVWVSGSWPTDHRDMPYEASIAEKIGHEIGLAGLTLVSGSGITIGAAAVGGFLNALQKTGSWDLERRLLVRPFTQPVKGASPNKKQWDELRAEMARLAGTVVFVGGAKLQGGKISDQIGVLEERDVASHLDKFLLPVGRSGGSAAIIARDLIGSSVPFNGPKARRPSDKELIALQDEGDPGKLAKLVAKILKRKSSGLD